MRYARRRMLLRPRSLLIAGTLALIGCEEGQGIGRLVAKGAFEPASLDFGEITVGTKKTMPVKLANTGEIALNVEAVGAPASFTIAQMKGKVENVTLAPSEKLDLEVTYLAIAEGEASGKFVATHADGMFELEVRGTGVIQRVPQLSLDPTSLAFGTIVIGTEARAMVTIKNEGLADGTIDRISLRSTGADVRSDDEYRFEGQLPVVVPAEGQVRVAVVYAPKAEGQRGDTMIFGTAGAGAPLELVLDGVGQVPLGVLACTPTPLDFGQVQRGMTAARTVSCEARGGPVRVIGANLGVGTMLFAMPTPPGTSDLTEGQKTEIALEFRSDGLPMAHRGMLTVSYNGSSGPSTVVVPLIGEVTPPPPTATAISLELRWDTNLTDVDLHLVRPGGQLFDERNDGDCFFGAPNPEWGNGQAMDDNPFLDVDDTDGRGPEKINLSVAPPGTYQVYVHYFADNGVGATTPTVQVHLGGRMIANVNRRLTCNQMWLAGTINWNGTTGTFQPTGNVTRSNEGDCN